MEVSQTFRAGFSLLNGPQAQIKLSINFTTLDSEMRSTEHILYFCCPYCKSFFSFEGVANEESIKSNISFKNYHNKLNTTLFLHETKD